jgi:hypothetical protein
VGCIDYPSLIRPMDVVVRRRGTPRRSLTVFDRLSIEPEVTEAKRAEAASMLSLQEQKNWEHKLRLVPQNSIQDAGELSGRYAPVAAPLHSHRVMSSESPGKKSPPNRGSPPRNSPSHRSMRSPSQSHGYHSITPPCVNRSPSAVSFPIRQRPFGGSNLWEHKKTPVARAPAQSEAPPSSDVLDLTLEYHPLQTKHDDRRVGDFANLRQQFQSISQLQLPSASKGKSRPWSGTVRRGGSAKEDMATAIASSSSLLSSLALSPAAVLDGHDEPAALTEPVPTSLDVGTNEEVEPVERAPSSMTVMEEVIRSSSPFPFYNSSLHSVELSEPPSPNGQSGLWAVDKEGIGIAKEKGKDEDDKDNEVHNERENEGKVASDSSDPLWEHQQEGFTSTISNGAINRCNFNKKNEQRSLYLQDILLSKGEKTKSKYVPLNTASFAIFYEDVSPRPPIKTTQRQSKGTPL